MKSKTLKEILIYIGLFALLALFVSIYVYHTQETSKIIDFEIFCDFENQNEDLSFKTDNKDYTIASGETSETIVFSGESSLYVPAWAKFQSLVVLANVKSPSFITISLKKHNSSDAFIVAQGQNSKDFYHRSNQAIETFENGWEEIKLKFTTGVDFNDTINIYIFNLNQKDTYIDDIKISVSGKPQNPEFKSEEPLLIYIEDKEMSKLNKHREEALSKGILQTNDDSWVNAIVYGENNMMQAEVRLKGDWLDHLIGDKWSFRIKLRDDSWKGMRVFSVQTPEARGFINEWIMHKICKYEDILTGRYGFVPIYLNGNSLGMYAYEEHFQKELIESSKRREGPIIKFSETDFWDFFLNKTPNTVAYRTSVIEPFSEGKTLNDSVKLQQFILASNLLDMYRNMKAPASEIFDIKKMSKFLALLNSKNAFHGLQWHNIRYYYNPVLCRLEPIAFDMFAGGEEFSTSCPITPMLLKTIPDLRRNSFCFLSNDSVFTKEYLKFVHHYSYNLDYSYFSSKYYSNYNHWDSLLRIEFNPYQIDTTQFTTVLEKMDNYLPAYKDSLQQEGYRKRLNDLQNIKFDCSSVLKPETFADKYVKCFKKDINTLEIKIYMYKDISILGFGSENELLENKSISIKNTDQYEIENAEMLTPTSSSSDYLYFTIPQKDTIFKTKIVPWPAPTTYNPRNDIASNATDISEYTNIASKTIVFSGNISFNNHVYIPSGYTVVFDAGTTIDIINSAAFISNSTVLINGTKEKPVKIFSSDKTANGFTVLQAENLSTIKYAEFDNFNTLNYNGWVLTGAINFYESDVQITNSTFTNNHCEDMLNTIRCDFLIKDCNIKNTFSDSHDSDFCTGTLDNCVFTDNGNDAIDFSTSVVTILNCTINGAVDKGISVGENTNATIKNITITNVNIGIASKDLSHADIDNCDISNANYGFVLLQKKPEFGPATITAKNCKLNDIWTESLIEQKSTLILNGKTFEGKKQKLKALFYE